MSFTPTPNKFDISNRVFTILVIFLIGLVGFWSFRAFEIWSMTSGNYPPREISVEGKGTALVTPDIARVTLGVNTQGKNSKDIVKENTKKINDIMKALTDLGIEKKDIKTTSYYLNPNYQYTETKGSVQDGYMLDQSIEVTVRNFEIIGDVIAKSTEVGANTIGGANFTVEDPETAKAEAREKAIKNANKKAQQMADATGFKLGKVTSFYEYETYPEYGKGGMGGDIMAMEEVPTPTVEPGQQEVSLTVSLSYRIY